VSFNKYLVPIFCIIIILSSALANDTVFLREDFSSLDNWKQLYFPKIKAHTKYSIETEGGTHYLKAESTASASALVYRKEFNVYEYPKAKWRWKVSNVYKKALPGTKDGDDYPVRIYIIFKYDPAKDSFFGKIKYEAIRAIYGQYPPDSSLNYIWASSPDNPKIMASPYTDRAQLIALERGSTRVGEWVEESVDILGDYRKAFGTEPPLMASIAIMNDSDNTGENSVSYISNIEVYK
jgi:hypothetical protein